MFLQLRLLVQPPTFFHLEDVKTAREVRRSPVQSEIKFVEKEECRRVPQKAAVRISKAGAREPRLPISVTRRDPSRCS
jgi:hypothetical protein